MKKKERKTFYACYDSKCSTLSDTYVNSVMHYMSMHVSLVPTQTNCDIMTCPAKKKCPFEVEVTRTNGRRGSHSARSAKNTIAAHVFKEHDIPSHPSLEIVECKFTKNVLMTKVKKNTTTSRRAYHCSRCDYCELVPEKLGQMDYKPLKDRFLKHFYDTHLQC